MITKKNDEELIRLLLIAFIFPIIIGVGIYQLARPVSKWLKANDLSFYFGGLLLFIAFGLWVLWKYTIALDPLIEFFSIRHILAWIAEMKFSSLFSRRLTMLLAKYCFYTVPLSIPIAFAIPVYKKNFSKEKFEKRASKFHEIFKPELFEKSRYSPKGVFLGFDKVTREPLYLNKKELGMHTQVLGATGFGKTDSVLMSRIDYDIRNGHGMIFIDGKGDLDFYLKLRAMADQYGRQKDFRFFSLVAKDASEGWNPLIRGSSTERKDRLIGSQLWSEEFYKKKGEEVSLTLFNVFSDLEITPSFKKLEQLFRNPDDELISGRGFKNKDVERKFKEYCDRFKADAKNYGGLASDISLITSSDFGHLFEVEKGEGIDLLEAYEKNQIVYFHLPILRLEESAKRIGRMVIHDLKTVCAHIQTTTLADQRRYFPVYIDEFASFAGTNFVELLNKARSAGVALTICHQSMGDLQSISDNFARQIFENTNCKIILRIDDPETVETYCRMIGTMPSVKMTYQTEQQFLGRSLSGGASLREVDEYKVDPNEFRNLKIGDAIAYIKSTGRVHRVKLDHINTEIPPYLRNFVFDTSRQADRRNIVVEEGTQPELKRITKRKLSGGLK